MAKCRLTEKIEIESLTETKDTQGFRTKVWIEFYKCWSNLKTISGREYIAAKATQSQDIVSFTIRYCKKSSELLKKDATKLFRVKYKDKNYNIEYVNDFENLHDWIDIKCSEND